MSQDGASYRDSRTFRSEARVLTGWLELIWNVLISSCLVKTWVFLGLDLQLVHWCSAGDAGTEGLILVIQQWQKWNFCCCGWLVKSGVIGDPFWGYRREEKVAIVTVRYKAAGCWRGSNPTAMLWLLFIIRSVTVLVHELKGQYRLTGGKTWRKKVS